MLRANGTAMNPSIEGASSMKGSDGTGGAGDTARGRTQDYVDTDSLGIEGHSSTKDSDGLGGAGDM